MADTDRQKDQDQAPEREPYVPPMAEDIDTTHNPAEIGAGVQGQIGGSLSARQGVEDSSRWH